MKYQLLIIVFLLVSCRDEKQEKKPHTQLSHKTDTIKIHEPDNPEQYIIQKDCLLGVVNGNKIVYDYAQYHYEHGNSGDYLIINAISKEIKKEIYTEQLYDGLNEVSLVYFYNQPFIYISIQDARNNYGNFYSINRNTFKLTEVREDTSYRGTIKNNHIPNFKDDDWEYRGTQSMQFDGKTISSETYYRKNDGSGESYRCTEVYKMSKDMTGKFVLRCTSITIE